MIFMKRLYPSITIFAIALLAYGLLIPQLGFYWDDLPISWIRYQLGPEALVAYFATSRPVWGVLFEITSRLIPQNPIAWQVFAFFWRWVCAVIVYMVFAKLWKDRPRLALGVALLFLVYPGFDQHFTAYLYSHFYIVIFFFLFSFLCMLIASESPEHYWAWTAAGLLFSALNLWMTEYFFLLELMRVGVILIMLHDEQLRFFERARRALKLWTPYLTLFVLAVLSRLFVFNNQYEMGLGSETDTSLLATLRNLAHDFELALRLVLRDAWLRMFDVPETLRAGSVLTSYYVIVIIVILVAAAGFLLLPRDAAGSARKNLADGLWMFGLGILAVSLSGWPFWLIGFHPSLEWPASRFTLPFILGVCLIFGGLIAALPWERLRIVLFVSLICLAAGKQYLISRAYVQDWNIQKDLFWQMTWRAPGLKPDTLVLLNEGALHYYADNSLSVALNWIYAPDNHTEHIEYVLFYPTTRLRNDLPKLEPGLPITYDYLAGKFNGNTSQTVAMYYAPPGCLRILDPEIESRNRLIPEKSLMRFAANISDPGLIVNEPRAKMPAVYGPEPEHGFCYYFQQAELARQYKDWDSVVKNGEIALSLSDHPYEPAEQFVFIEGYAHVGEWERAVDLSKDAYDVSPDITGRMLCGLWSRIVAETTDSLERSAALSEIERMIACDL